MAVVDKAKIYAKANFCHSIYLPHYYSLCSAFGLVAFPQISPQIISITSSSQCHLFFHTTKCLHLKMPDLLWPKNLKLTYHKS